MFLSIKPVYFYANILPEILLTILIVDPYVIHNFFGINLRTSYFIFIHCCWYPLLKNISFI